jgi:hypothetical protein
MEVEKINTDCDKVNETQKDLINDKERQNKNRIMPTEVELSNHFE